MHDKGLYATIPGMRTPWQVVDVALRAADQQVEVFIEHDGEAPLSCPQCSQPVARYDTRRRTWRHLDTCQYQTRLTAEVPRVNCPEHGVHQVPVPWSEPNSRFTVLFGVAGNRLAARGEPVGGVAPSAPDLGIVPRQVV